MFDLLSLKDSTTLDQLRSYLAKIINALCNACCCCVVKVGKHLYVACRKQKHF